MNSSLKRRLAAFQRATRGSAKYHISQRTPHERAIAEDIKRYGERMVPHLPLLDARNRI